MENNEKVETVTEETENQETKDTEVLQDGNDGESVTFEEIINHPTYQKDFRKAVDREVSKAIKSYQKNHETDVEKLVSEQVSAKVRDVKFNATLKEKLHDAGVIDNTAFIAHLDLSKLKESYEETTESIKNIDDVISNARQSMPYLFKQENSQPFSTGQKQEGFGSKPTSEVHSLRDALNMKYKK